MCYRLSGLQIAMGILSLIFAIVLYGMEHSDDQGADVITYISHGIWMGFIVRHYYGYVQYGIKSLVNMARFYSIPTPAMQFFEL